MSCNRGENRPQHSGGCRGRAGSSVGGHLGIAKGWGKKDRFFSGTGRVRVALTDQRNEAGM